MGARVEATLVLKALNRALGRRQIKQGQLPDPHQSGHPVLGGYLSGAGGGPQDQLPHVSPRPLKHGIELDDDAVRVHSPEQLIRHLAFWIDAYYNHERRQSTISWLSAIAYGGSS